ncbi:hypothetical protein K503DRAFT_797684 [Rhizopogon vinicolor AM-OR11-026]|uniref:GTP-binding protein 2 n=1 Tax=Rhizopogon vinicolor AM-OR11-026 TaxID=1314800 RepID=A0A1B7NAE8_9AGAM|nr:hypothetical protein K503DRAFT_797684 [Rhizopogon vinicolor AM-OR11-026]
MFGESDSESPRVPSPWDSLTSVSPTPTHDEILRRGIPKLVPENEEGNVEYKLHLLSPSPTRFTHLVTQLKWRLLEGGGQAYYELGVTDSGVLVGLARREMEETLGTLEEMAGEIGASVIVVKEIEVPTDVSGVVGGWGRDEGKRCRQRQLMGEDSETTTETELETELETTDADDDLPAASSHVEMFSMDEGDLSLSSESAALTVDLEIATVYKPRPFRRRVASTVQGNPERRIFKGKKPKHLLAHTRTQPKSHSEHHTHHTHHSNLHNHPVHTVPTHAAEFQGHIASESNQSKGRASRDKRREAKRNPLLQHVPTIRIDIAEMGELVSDLESFHVTLQSDSSASVPPEVEPCTHEDVRFNGGLDSPAVDSFLSIVETHSAPSSHCQPEPLTSEFDSPPTEIMLRSSKSPTAEIMKASLGPRLIVEALVVRKLTLEEAFLDFGGFSVL